MKHWNGSLSLECNPNFDALCGTVFVDFVKLINDGLGPLSKCTWTLKTKLHPCVWNRKDTKGKSKRNTTKIRASKTNQLVFKKKKTSEKNGTQINGSSRLIPNFITWGFGSVVPRSGNQLNSSSVEETCVALDRCIHLPGWWGTHLPKNGWVFQKWWALEKAQTGIRFCLGHFLGYVIFFLGCQLVLELISYSKNENHRRYSTWCSLVSFIFCEKSS